MTPLSTKYQVFGRLDFFLVLTHKYTHILFNLVSMGSGVTWEKEEDDSLARSWVAASEDSITGTGQKASKF